MDVNEEFKFLWGGVFLGKFTQKIGGGGGGGGVRGSGLGVRVDVNEELKFL